MANEASETSKEAKTSKSRLLIIVLLALAILIIILLGVVIFLLMRKPEATPEPVWDAVLPVGDARATIVTKDNVDDVMSQIAQPVEAGHYSCKMNVEWYFKDSSKPSYNAYVANSPRNTHTVYFDVNLEDGGKLVYSSPYMPVGTELDEIQLTEELDAGTYPAVVTYHLVSEEKKELSTVSVTVTLFIEN